MREMKLKPWRNRGTEVEKTVTIQVLSRNKATHFTPYTNILPLEPDKQR
jgi:hypothetical protein